MSCTHVQRENLNPVVYDCLFRVIRLSVDFGDLVGCVVLVCECSVFILVVLYAVLIGVNAVFVFHDADRAAGTVRYKADNLFVRCALVHPCCVGATICIAEYAADICIKSVSESVVEYAVAACNVDRTAGAFGVNQVCLIKNGFFII